jgi:hypothetical protein
VAITYTAPREDRRCRNSGSWGWQCRRSALPRRTWEAKRQALLVREGRQGKPVAAICPAPRMRQARDDQWRDPVLAHAAQAVDDPPRPRSEARLAQEHARLTPRGGARTVAGKTSAERLA